MPQRIIRRILTLFALGLISATIVLAQPLPSATAPGATVDGSWKVAQTIGSSKSKLLVVTADEPQRKQSCRVQSFTADKLVCSGRGGASRTYLPQQLLAVMLPGYRAHKVLWLLALNAGLGAAIWGTAVLAPTCPLCAAATGTEALGLFGGIGAALCADDQPRVIYLAAGEHLPGKLRLARAQ